MVVSLSSSKMITRVYLLALFCTAVRSAEKNQQNPEDLATNRDTPMVSPQSRKTDPKLDVKITINQPGQLDELHPEMFSSSKDVGKDAPEFGSRKSKLIGEAKSELSESALVPAVPPNPALSRSRRLLLPYLSSYLYRRPYYRRPYYRRPYVRGAYYPYYFGGIFGYPYYGGYGSYGYGDYGGGYYGGYGDYDAGGYGDYGGGYADYGGGFGDYGGGYGDYGGGYGDYGGGYGDYGGGYGDVGIGIDSDY